MDRQERTGHADGGMNTGTDRESDIVATMTRLADSLVSDFDQFDLLTDLTESCVRILDADDAGVSLTDGSSLQFVAATSERMELIELFQTDRQEGPCQDAFRAGHHIGVSDVEATVERWPVWAPRALRLDFRAADAFPLRLRNDVIGALNVYSRERRQLESRDVSVANALADIATLGLLQERAIADAERVRDQLQRALDGRVVIEQAKGVIAANASLPVDRAFERIRGHARSHNLRVVDVARDIVDGRIDLVGEP